MVKQMVVQIGDKIVVLDNGQLVSVEVTEVLHNAVAYGVKEPDGRVFYIGSLGVITSVANRYTMEALEELLPKPIKSYDHLVETADHLGAHADITQIIAEHKEGAGER